VQILIIDALASNEGERKFTRDVIGIGPRLLAGICEQFQLFVRIVRVEDLLSEPVNVSVSTFDIFLISAMSVDFIAVKRVITLLREKNRNGLIILGGSIVSDSGIIEQLDVDIGVYGEGEKILEKLILSDFSVSAHLEKDSDYPINTLKIGSKYLLSHSNPLDETVFYFSPSTSRITDYADYWFSRVYVEVVRGCSNFIRGNIVRSIGKCSDCGSCDDPDEIISPTCPDDIPAGCGFCSVPVTFGSPRSRPIDLIEKEVKELFDLGVRRIILSAPGFLDFYRGDDNTTFSPTFPPANVEKIEELLERLTKVRDKYEYRSIAIENIKPSLMTEEIAGIFGKYLPKTPISIGCETFHTELSKKLGRPTDPIETIRASKLLSKKGLKPQIYLIHSLPGETVEALEKTSNIVRNELDDIADKVTVYKYLPLPNSPFSQMEVQSPPERHLLKLKREELKSVIIEFNKKKKLEMLGEQYNVIVAERDRKRKDIYIAYILSGGPAISLYNKSNIIGKIAKVEIVEVISDKLLKGKILDIE